MSFYAVANGKQIGIQSTWTECKANTDGYRGAIQKKFSRKEDAEQFINERNEKTEDIVLKKVEEEMPLGSKSAFDILMKPTPSTKILEVQESVWKPDYFVYTDGACMNNGKEDAMAGIGIYFGENDPRNVSQRVEGKQSNNTAELGAIIYTYSLIENDIRDGKLVGIVSDSMYAIGCVTEYGKKCELGHWKKDIPNKEMVKQAYELYKNISNVRFFHIMSHTEKTDIHSLGNDGADKLANKAIGVTLCPQNSTNNKIYLIVPFTEKERIKKYGGRWDPAKKMWYISANTDNKEEIFGLFTISS